MNLKLNIYTDESLAEIKRTVEAEEVKIPYRVAMNIINSLEGVSVKNNDDLISFVGKSIDKLDKIIKATFKVSESELDCIDASELITVCVDLYNWALGKMNKFNGGNDSKNSLETVEKN